MWDLKCIAAALCFTVSNILFVVHGALMHKSSSHGSSNSSSTDTTTSGFSFESWKDLDPIYIESRWTEQHKQRAIVMCAALFGSLAWFLMIGPLLQSAWVLSRGGRRLVGPHVLLATLAVCGGIIEFLARLLTVGMTNASQWLANDFNLSDWGGVEEGIGWRVLEMIHIVTVGMLLWVDAFESLAFFGIAVIFHYSVATEETKIKQSLDNTTENGVAEEDSSSGVIGTNASSVDGGSSVDDKSSVTSPPPAAFAAVSTKTSTTLTIIKPTFTKRFVYYGLCIGVLSLLDFVADVLRFVNWKVFGTIAMATNIIVGAVLLPIWLLCLARQLPRATEQYERAEGRARILLDRYGNGESASLISEQGGGEIM